MVKNGIEQLIASGYGLENKRLALVSAPAAVNSKLVSTLDLLHEHFRLELLLAPEHGIRGDVQAGGVVENCVDARTGVRVQSLYGGNNRCEAGALDQVDAVVYDIQDVGCRYYTFMSTMKNMLHTCAEAGKPFVLLDRVNPIADPVEGNALDMAFSSFVGIAPVPQRHGLTLGELARFFNEEYKIGCDLTVVPVENWKRTQYYDETGLPWVNPSPNIPGIDAAILYPGTCLFEGTNLSEGRGTTKPFEMIGAPWLDAEELAGRMNDKKLAGVAFRPTYFQPWFSKHQGQLCKGVQLHITDRQVFRPLLAGLQLLKETAVMSGDKLTWIPPNQEKGECFLDLLAGTDSLRKSLDVDSYYENCIRDSAAFAERAKPYRIYD